MPAPIRLEQIEESEMVRRLLRQTITDEILSGVRQLDEAKELEPFLREILSDRTETAHSSTEIADILTTHVTIQGEPQFVAFVNKGKATPKVTSKLVAHQVTRLHIVPLLDLIVLLAVGEIQDDIKRDFTLAAEHKNVDYLIIDAVDVARLLIVYHKICPRDGTPYRAGHCPICLTAASEPIQLTLDVYEAPTYETLSTEDISTNIKRYRAFIQTDPHYSKAVLREVIKQAIEDIKGQRLFNTDRAEAHFGDRDADYVGLFVYLSGYDQQTNNYVCRAAWLRSELADEHSSLRLNGNEWLGEIEIDWNHSYQQRKSEWLEYRGTKEGWLKNIAATFPEMERLMKQAKALLDAYEGHHIDQATLQHRIAQLEPVVSGIDRQSGNSEVAPLECKDCDTMFQGVRGRFSNTFIAFAPWIKKESPWENRLWLLRYGVRDYEEDKSRFLYELKKVDPRLYRRLSNL